jgi:hypothetical protein
MATILMAVQIKRIYQELEQIKQRMKRDVENINSDIHGELYDRWAEIQTGQFRRRHDR